MVYSIEMMLKLSVGTVMQVFAFQTLRLPDGIDLPGCGVNDSFALRSTFFGHYEKACSALVLCLQTRLHIT